MKLSRLYANQPERFEAIVFVAGLNVVMAEIRRPENRDLDSHNLGKSTLGGLLNFCLLAGKDTAFHKHSDVFKEFVFFLEIELDAKSFVTVRRSVAEPTKISLMAHDAPGQDYSGLPEKEFSHSRVAIDRAETLLEGQFDLSALGPYAFRKSTGYLLRGQNDYTNVFKLARDKGKDADWKPFVAHLLGFDSSAISRAYIKEAALQEIKDTEKRVEAELGGSVEEISKVEGTLRLKQREAKERQEALDQFNFASRDREVIANLVDDIDSQLAEVNELAYDLAFNLKKVQSAIKENTNTFDVASASALFEEAGAVFGGQLRKDFEQLVEFNKSITAERRKYLREEEKELKSKIAEARTEAERLSADRSEKLAYLSSTDSVRKYKSVSKKLVELNSEVQELNRRREHLQQLQRLRESKRAAQEELDAMQRLVEADVETKSAAESDSLFNTIRGYFDDIVRSVIGRNALLTATLNAYSHLEFEAEILGDRGQSTAEADGHTYQKLLCVAFDLAVMRGHLGTGYPKFVYHDGVFEALDPRKRSNLLDVMREYSDLGVQQVITLLDSDTPPTDDETPPFDDAEIVLRLHDEDESGRLFKMDRW